MVVRYFDFYRAFEPRERRIFWLLLLSSVFDGAASGVFLLQETIAKKALGASDFQVSLIGLIATATMVFSVAVGLFFADRRKTWLLAACMVLGRLVFLSAYAIKGSGPFLLLLLLYYSMYSIQGPIFSSFFQKHIEQYRGRVFSLTRMVLLIFSMAAALTAGRLLDISPLYYRPILLSVALSGTAMYLIYIALDLQIDYPAEKSSTIGKTLRQYREMIRRKDFLMFEAMFMSYGLGILMMMPTVPLFLINRLGFTYFQMAKAIGLYAQLFVILLLPLVGMLYDRVDLWKLASVSLLVLLGYPLCLMGSSLAMSRTLAYAGMLFYSLGVVGIMVMWNLGSLHFSGDADSFIYQGFHVTLTGIRGLAGPMLGYLMLSRVSFLASFAAAALFLVLALGLSVQCCREFPGAKPHSKP